MFFLLSYQFEQRIAKIIFNSIGKASSCFSELNYTNQFNRELLGPKWQRVSVKERGKKREIEIVQRSEGKRAKEKERIQTIIKERALSVKEKRAKNTEERAKESEKDRRKKKRDKRAKESRIVLYTDKKSKGKSKA